MDKANAKESAKTLRKVTKEIQDLLVAVTDRLDNDGNSVALCTVGAP